MPPEVSVSETESEPPSEDKGSVHEPFSQTSDHELVDMTETENDDEEAKTPVENKLSLFVHILSNLNTFY